CATVIRKPARRKRSMVACSRLPFGNPSLSVTSPSFRRSAGGASCAGRPPGRSRVYLSAGGCGALGSPCAPRARLHSLTVVAPGEAPRGRPGGPAAQHCRRGKEHHMAARPRPTRLFVLFVVLALAAGLVWGLTGALASDSSPSPAAGKVVM